MSLRAVLAFTLCAAFAAGADDFAWDPVKGVQALNAVKQAIHGLTMLPHLTAAQMTSAKKVDQDVSHAIDALEHGKDLSQNAKSDMVAGAMRELEGLQREWDQAAANASARVKAADDRYDALEKELEKKKAMIAKDQQLMGVYTLEKELDEKKLKLTKLQQLKAQAAEQARERAAKEEAAQQSAMMAKLVATAKSMAGARKSASGANTAALKPVLENLQRRVQNVTKELSEMDEAEKKREAEIKELVDQKVGLKAGVLGNGTLKAKKASMLKYVMKTESRKYRKARALKQAELSELKGAVGDIEKGDSAGLQKIMNKMQREMRTAQASTGGFLY